MRMERLVNRNGKAHRHACCCTMLFGHTMPRKTIISET